jgi:hypothetical protein
MKTEETDQIPAPAPALAVTATPTPLQAGSPRAEVKNEDVSPNDQLKVTIDSRAAVRILISSG